ncbi:cytochrome P450 3A41-like [Centruroides sculpturatus]|uniref:cytochrome P450 3A41-like n=1 Tax=Centruroides sculpturatus TaxID=218467 RepID=UPI000C6D89DD|nr:cytochrome P450 3A41-like [Centruroides sculpturatus]
MSSILILLAVFVCLLSFWIRWRKRQMCIFQRYGIPGPEPNFITGNLIEYNKKRNKCLDEWLEKYGNVFGFFLGGKPCVVCRDLELIKLIQIKDFKSFMNRDLLLPDAGIPNNNVLNSLPLQKDEDWRISRNILSTSFSTAKLKMMSTLMFEPINVFLEKIDKQKKSPFDIAEFYKKLTFDLICRTAFGIQTNVQNEETSKIVQSIHGILTVDSTDLLTSLSICFPEMEPIPTYMRMILDKIKYLINYPCCKLVFDTCRQIIFSRKTSGYHPPDLLQIMIDAEGETDGVIKKLATDSIVANAVMYMLAGNDTTGTMLAWCTHNLVKYPEEQERVRQEINENIESNKQIEYADLSKLKYLDQIISETLRLRSLSPITINRICSEDFHYKNITIPKGVTVMIPVPNLHKDCKYWKDSGDFNPDRFSSKTAGQIDQTIYQPFGFGPRSCIGMRLAQTIMKLTLANLIKSYNLELCGNLEAEEDFSLFTTRPKNGVVVKATALSS